MGTPKGTVRAAAETLLEQGLRIWPVSEKRPTGKGFGDLTLSADVGDFRGREDIAVLTGPCPAGEPGDRWLLCIDLDGGIKRKEASKRLGTKLPPTLATHRGAHLWYWLPPSAERDQLKQWNGLLGERQRWTKAGRRGDKPADIDLKWCGGYAVERNPAEFDPAKIAELPRKALRKVLRAPGVPRSAPAELGEADAELPDVSPLDADAETALIEACIEEWPDAGGGRHDAAKALGGALRRAGVDRRSAERIAVAVQDGVGSDAPRVRVQGTLDAWDRTHRGETAFGLGTLRGLLANDGAATADALAGCARPSSALLSWLTARAKAGHRWARAALADAEAEDDAGDYWEMASDWPTDLPEVEWLCPRLGIPVGGRPHMVIAESGSGKTWSVLALALAVASGGKLFGEFECKQGSVRILENDQGRHATVQQMQYLARAQRLQLADLDIGAHYYDFDAVVSGEEIDQRAVARLTARLQGVDLCVIDAVTSLGGALSENDARYGHVLMALASVTEETGTTFVLLHHCGKSDGSKQGAGTYAFKARAGCQWLLHKDGTWAQLKKSELAIDHSAPFRTEFKASNTERRAHITATATDAGAVGAPTDAERAAIAAFLDGQQGAGERETLMALERFGRPRVKDLLAVMIADGQITKEGKGQQVRLYLTAEGRELV